MREYDPTLGRYIQADPLGLVDGASVYGYALQNPVRYVDPTGEQTLGTDVLRGPRCLILGQCGQNQSQPQSCRQEINILLPGFGLPEFSLPPVLNSSSSPKEPGKPGEKEGFKAPKGGAGELVKAPDGKQKGYRDKNGNLWIPTGKGGKAHGGPHWDVQRPGGGYINVHPGGNQRGGKKPFPKF